MIDSSVLCDFSHRGWAILNHIGFTAGLHCWNHCSGCTAADWSSSHVNQYDSHSLTPWARLCVLKGWLHVWVYFCIVCKIVWFECNNDLLLSLWRWFSLLITMGNAMGLLTYCHSNNCLPFTHTELYALNRRWLVHGQVCFVFGAKYVCIEHQSNLCVEGLPSNV